MVRPRGRVAESRLAKSHVECVVSTWSLPRIATVSRMDRIAPWAVPLIIESTRVPTTTAKGLSFDRASGRGKYFLDGASLHSSGRTKWKFF